ncbi:homocysteine S-methyltransferase family protein, partial [Microbacterium testaceum]|uniref:homocysteine S-methyltransferase family protein n=1 Tax=Microbacterium testaceum TaxID=2033 RepID=UPI000734887D
MIDLGTTLAERPIILDGGLGTLLESRGNDVSSSLWSARVLRDDPDEVRAAHAEFVTAGADLLITASYQVGFGAEIPDAEVETLLRRSVTLAREAGDAVVAASVGPLGALRADGSEYTGDDGLTVSELRDAHRRRLHVLADAGADLLAVETVPSLRELEALALELADLRVPAIVSLSADSTSLRTPGALSRAFEIAASV